MIKTFEKIKDVEQPQFSMPLSLRIIKECSQNSIDWKCLHIIDLFSIIYSIRIDNAKQYLKQKKQEMLNKRGIKSVTKATEEDFDRL